MGTQNIQPIKIVRKPSARETLLYMETGITYRIKSRQFKANVIRATATELKKKGYEFTVSEAGLIDEVLVTRIR